MSAHNFIGNLIRAHDTCFCCAKNWYVQTNKQRQWAWIGYDGWIAFHVSFFFTFSKARARTVSPLKKEISGAVELIIRETILLE